MKNLILPATILLLAACTAPPHNDVPLQAQAPAPMGTPQTPSTIDQNIIGSRHSRYARQPNEVNNALWGGAIGAGVGNVIGHDGESTAYGAAAGILGGYYGGCYLWR